MFNKPKNIVSIVDDDESVREAIKRLVRSLGYSATRHQAEVGTSYFDRVSEVVSRGTASTLALAGSTERAQFAAPNGKGDGRPERVLD